MDEENIIKCGNSKYKERGGREEDRISHTEGRGGDPIKIQLWVKGCI